MKCKCFSTNWQADREKEINEWLAKNQNIKIDHVANVTVSSDSGRIYIFYSTRKDKLDFLDSLNDQ